MKVRSALLTEMSGKIGGAVASRARGGIQYFRALVTPTNPRTFLQTAIRNAVSSASALWLSTLDEDQQQLWWDMAEGSQSGKSLFAKVNQARIFATNTGRVVNLAGGAGDILPLYFLTPPLSLSTVLDGFLSPPEIDASANTLNLGELGVDPTWAVGADSTHKAIIYVYVSAGQTPSRFARQHPYQLAAAIVLVSSAGGDTPVIDLAALGIPTVTGRIMYVKLVVQSPTGGISTALEQRVTVIA